MIVLLGILIGFWGYLMIGNINLAVTELAASDTFFSLLQFILLAVFFESLYCFFTLFSLRFLAQYPFWMSLAKHISILFLLLMGIWIFFEKKSNNSAVHKNIVRRGYWAMIIHPQQIPFWFFWGLVLMERAVLTTAIYDLLLFTLANALGAGIVLSLYALWGNTLLHFLKLNRQKVSYLVAFVCWFTAVLIFYDLYLA